MPEQELPRPSGIAWDCDGLLVETESLWTLAEAEMFAARGLEFGPELKTELIGTSIHFTVARFVELFDEPGGAAALTAELTERVAAVMAARAEPMPGAVELVRAASGKLPMVVVSNSDARLVRLSLERAGLADAFDALVTLGDVAAGKPAPDLYLRGCELMGISPPTAIAFEDTVVGVQAARAAGVPVVGIPTVRQPGFAPDFRFATLADPRLLAWVDAL